MEFRIADTFTDSLARLTGEQQKAVKTTAFDLQLNPTQPGMQLHKLDQARDPHFWSVRVSRDIRLIVHRTDASLLLCYVDHHDEAYRWAERRKLETHPKTGAAQLVEIRETVQEIIVPTYVTAAQPGDLGQRIFQPPFSWKALGVDIRGHSRTLHVHYRTSRQIRMRADRLLGPKLSDVDGYTEQSVG